VLGFLAGEALRDLRRAGRLVVSAVLLTALSLAAVGGFWIMSANLGQAIAQWRSRVRVIVYLASEPAPAELPAVLERVQALAGVAGVSYVSRAAALESLRHVLGNDAGVLDELSANPLPASLEVTPSAAGSTPEGVGELVAALAALPGVEEVAGGVGWVDRLSHWQYLLTTVGLGLGALLGVAAILTVTTATTLALHARRREIQIMRLVGAPELVVRLPLLLQGAAQGLTGGALAVLALAGVHAFAAPRLQPTVNLTFGLPDVQFLPAASLVVLLAGGVLLGALGGWLARGQAE
jgi:cell division transport system permease protein